MFTVLDYEDTVDEHVWNAEGIMMGVVELSSVLNFIGVKENDVGPIAFTKLAAASEVKCVCRQAGHFANGIFEPQDLQFAHVTAKYTGVIAVAARVRHIL